MNSPFYDAEQRLMFPHRILVNGGSDQILKHMKHLIEIDADNEKNMRSTTLLQLKHKYFINATNEEILTAFDLLKS
jgi:hypothetical protein